MTGDDAVAVAERAALGTSARIAVWPPECLDTAQRLHGRRGPGRPRPSGEPVPARLGDLLDPSGWRRPVHAQRRACRGCRRRARGRTMDPGGPWPTRRSATRSSARATTGTSPRSTPARPDPPATAGQPGAGLAAPVQGSLRRPAAPSGRACGWTLGATAKGLGSDRAVRAAMSACGQAGGVLVALGGDMAVAGTPPRGGWPVTVVGGLDPDELVARRADGPPRAAARSPPRRSPAGPVGGRGGQDAAPHHRSAHWSAQPAGAG